MKTDHERIGISFEMFKKEMNELDSEFTNCLMKTVDKFHNNLRPVMKLLGEESEEEYDKIWIYHSEYTHFDTDVYRYDIYNYFRKNKDKLDEWTNILYMELL